MPRAKLTVELDRPEDHFEILKGEGTLKRCMVDLKVNGSELVIDIDAEDGRALASALGSVIKQMRIIEEASGALGKD